MPDQTVHKRLQTQITAKKTHSLRNQNILPEQQKKNNQVMLNTQQSCINLSLKNKLLK
jgi:hypothetical protein